MGAREPAAIVAPDDPVGAFAGSPAVLARGRDGGRLSGRSLAVKDLFDVAGTVTGAGNPTFAAGRRPASTNATAVQRLVDAGATVVGKTITDELAFSLSGTNVHYGTPINVAAPGRVPGGSSAGSAAAVAAGLVDLALGSDTGGSIRIPASYCGIIGWRPTHGAVPIDGVVPLAPSFDTVGLFATDADLLAVAADVLMGYEPDDGGTAPDTSQPTVALVAELLDDASDAVAAATRAASAKLGEAVTTVSLGIDLSEAMTTFRQCQGWEAWRSHGAWIEEVKPDLGPGIASRFAAASTITGAEHDHAVAARADIAAIVREATADGTILVVPGAASAAPGPSPDPAVHEAQRARSLRLTCLAGLAGAPVVVLPLAADDGLPLGVGLLGAPGSDRALLSFARRVMSGADR